MYEKKSSFWFWVLPPAIVTAILLVLHFGWWRAWMPDGKDQNEKKSESARPEVPAETADSSAPVSPDKPVAPLTATSSAIPPASPAPLPAPFATLSEAEQALLTLAGRISSHPQVVVWLANKDLLTRFVGAVETISRGGSPRAYVPFLGPSQPFASTGTPDFLTPDPGAYARYDLVTDVFASVDIKQAAEAYRRLSPVLEDIYRQQVPNAGKSFHDCLSETCRLLLAVPVLSQEPRLQYGGRVYYYADSALEQLTPAQKHLLRMGSANVERVQTVLRALVKALDPGIPFAGE